MALSPYVKIGDTVITQYVPASSPPKPIQPSRSIGSDPYIGTNRVSLTDKGKGVLGYRVECRFKPADYLDYDSVAAAFESLSDGDLFYPRSDRFGVCKFGNADPMAPINAAAGDMLRLEGTVWSEAAELYGTTPDEWGPTPTYAPLESSGITNNGNIKGGSPLYSVEIEGEYVSGHVEDLVLYLASGATTMATLSLLSRLMSGEVLTLDRFGQISQSYSDDFASATKFGHDGYCYAKLETAFTDGDADVVLTSVVNGGAGEDIKVTLVDPGGASQSLAITAVEALATEAGDDITTEGSDTITWPQGISVSLATDGASAISTTGSELVAALNADDDIPDFLTAALGEDADGTGIVEAMAETAFDLNVTVTGGALVIEDNREAEYHLPGNYPIKSAGLLIGFTPTDTGTGTVALEVSTDAGTIWETVIENSDSDWTDGEAMEVYVPQAISYTTVWIRFACDTSITSVSIDDLFITQLRAVPDSAVPKIPIGSTYTVKLDAGTVGYIDAAIVWRDRYIP